MKKGPTNKLIHYSFNEDYKTTKNIFLQIAIFWSIALHTTKMKYKNNIK